MFPAFQRDDARSWGVHVVDNLGDARDNYLNKASECLDLARGADGRRNGAWNKFLTMSMLWLRLAEEAERRNRLDATNRDRT